MHNIIVYLISYNHTETREVFNQRPPLIQVIIVSNICSISENLNLHPLEYAALLFPLLFNKRHGRLLESERLDTFIRYKWCTTLFFIYKQLDSVRALKVA